MGVVSGVSGRCLCLIRDCDVGLERRDEWVI